jgi:TolB-like protein/Tfp pilus assembly protein PilF
MAEPLPLIYEFDDFRVDAAARVLERGGESVALTPKVFDTLLYLVRNHGRALGKDELMRAIWPDVVVEENNLNQHISILRRALGTKGYIVTVQGRGYRFAADVRQRPRETATPSVKPRKAIAILPFVNMSADPENDYFCDGLAEELLGALTKLDGLKVAARTSSFSFKGRNVEIGRIADALGVGTIVEGSVRRSGVQLRIAVQLIDASTGYHLWSETYDRRMKDIFALQEEITLAVVDALKMKLLQQEKAAVLKRYTENTEAWHLYLKGRYYWYKTSPDEFRRSREYFERAIDLDPVYVLAYSGLADYYGLCSATGILEPDEGWPRALAALVKALEIDDTLAETCNPLAALKWIYERDWVGAEKAFKRGIELNPQFAEIHHLYSYYLAAAGRLDGALAESRLAMELDPLCVRFNLTVGWMFYIARRYDEAVSQYRKTLDLDAHTVAVHDCLGDTLERQGLYEAAVAEWRTAMILAGDDELAETLSRHYIQQGFAEAVREVARTKLARLSERYARGEYVAAWHFARAYVRLDSEQAFIWLEKACNERNKFPLDVNVDPFYDSLRGDPRYPDLVRRIGLAP